jgi:glycosyltransferase involved in cell wall biosynthesis
LIPAWNREEFIEEAIRSVFVQDYKDWDILVVDDGSTDRTASVVKSLVPNRDITLITSAHLGCPGATKLGIEQARGPIITVLDSDDQLTTDSLSSGVPPFRNNQKLGYLWTNFIRSTGRQGWCCKQPEGQTLFHALMNGWWKACAQRFFRKEHYMRSGGLDDSIPYAVDLQLALLVCSTGCDTKHVPKITYWRREHSSGNQISRECRGEQAACAKRIQRYFRKKYGKKRSA